MQAEKLSLIQKIMSVVIGVYKFGQEFFIIGIFWNILYKYQKKKIQLKLHKMHLCSMQKFIYNLHK